MEDLEVGDWGHGGGGEGRVGFQDAFIVGKLKGEAGQGCGVGLIADGWLSCHFTCVL